MKSQSVIAAIKTFLGLTDTPGSYSGTQGKVPAENAGGDALELVSHDGIDGTGSNSHAQIDTHLGSTLDPHSTLPVDISDDTNLVAGGSLTLTDDTLSVDDDFVKNAGGDEMAPKLTISDSASIPPLNITERSAEPSGPSSGDIYLDDGTNTASSNPGWRRYTGAAWEDVTAAAGSGAPGGADTQILYNDSGVSAGSVNHTFDKATNQVSISSGGLDVSGNGDTVLITGGTIANDATQQFFRVVGTLPTVPDPGTGFIPGINLDVTTAGSSGNARQGAVHTQLLPGYTGNQATIGMESDNGVSGTGTVYVHPTGSVNITCNQGLNAAAFGVTTGSNVGGWYFAQSGDINVGIVGQSLNGSVKNNVENIGIVGVAHDGGATGTKDVGGFFGLITSNPSLSVSAGLICDNGAETADIFQARDNGTVIAKIVNGGQVQALATLLCDNGVLASDIFVARDNGTPIFTIEDGGQVGIGASATTPARLLHLNGGNANDYFRIETDSKAYDIGIGVAASGDDKFGIFDASLTSWVFVNAGGLIGLGNVTSPAAQLHVDQPSSSGTIPVLTLDQGDVDEPFVKFIGTAAAADLSRNIVDNDDVGVATLQGWSKVEVQDDGNQIPDQDYFMPLYTLA